MRRALLGGALALLGAAAWFAGPSQAAPNLFPFPHKPHLSEKSFKGSDADCRVCHDYSKGATEAHLVGCDKCHVDEQHLARKVSASARPTFQHKEHLFDKSGAARVDVNCFTCHATLIQQESVEFKTEVAFAGKSAPGAPTKTCADCHAAHEPMNAAVPEFAKTGDGRACAECHKGETSILPLRYRGDVRSAAQKPFLHKDHGGATGDCDSCHAEIKSSKTVWDYDPTKGTAQLCASCHVGADKKPLVAVGDDTSITKIAFSNFPHEKHGGVFSKMSCQTCHFPETDPLGRTRFIPRAPSPEPTGRAQLLRFAACDTCHGRADWSPPKPSWHVEGHGVGAWACFKCHEGTAKDGKLPIATAQVSSRTMWSFKIAEHAHPGITRDGAALLDPTQGDKRCADCHKADVAQLASRLVDRKFDHAPHVGAGATTTACLSCHAESGVARRSEDVPPFGGMNDCKTCHVGNVVQGRIGSGERGPQKRTVPQFDHAGHVKSASLVEGVQGIACVECHAKGGEFGYETPADVLNCTKCHSHDGGPDDPKFKRTGPKASPTDAGKCLFCHTPDQMHPEGAGGVVGPVTRETIVRRNLVLTQGTQFHDKTGGCAACHVREGLAATPYESRLRAATVAPSIHKDPAFEGRPFNDPRIAEGARYGEVEPTLKTCAYCHRTEPRGYLRSLGRR